MKKLIVASILACGALAGNSFAAANCKTVVKSGVDEAGNKNPMAFNVKKIQVPKNCGKFEITLINETGLPKASFGHNLVVSKAADMKAVGDEGIKAGLQNDYLKRDDKVIAATKLLGGTEKKDNEDTITLDVSKLSADESYKFFCTFPGHIAMMQGDLELVEPTKS